MSNEDFQDFIGGDDRDTGGGGIEFPGLGRQDSYTEVTHISWGERLGGSIGGALLGVAIFIGSFYLLYWNEGLKDLSKLAAHAAEIPAQSQDVRQVGRLVSVTGPFRSSERLGDTFLEPGAYLAIHREVEMYAWKESSHSTTEKHAGGSETKRTTYTYDRGWTGSPSRSSSFKISSGHYNPDMGLRDGDVTVQQASVGMHGVQMDRLGLPTKKKLALTNANTRGAGRRSGDTLYLGNGSWGSPRVGDLRVTYSVVPAGQTVTLFGRLESNGAITPYFQGDESLFRALAGTKAQAVSTMHGEFVMTKWVLRLVGFLAMWFGLFLLFEPLNTLMDVLPFLGSLGRGIAGVGTFLTAAVLSVVTILVSMVLHNLVLMLVIVASTGLACLFLFSKKKEQVRRHRAPA